jgi:hypothetical protein
MSSQKRIQTSSSKVVASCKVCKDAGKTDFNHWTKDREGNTICPTLLAQKCRYCDKTGHTVKYCQVLAKKKKQEERSLTAVVTSTKAKKVDPSPVITTKNQFALLFENDDDEIKPKKKTKPVKEELTKSSDKIKPTFLEILNKPPPVATNASNVVTAFGFQVEIAPVDKTKAIVKHNSDCHYRRNGLSWADAVDDDDDE